MNRQSRSTLKMFQSFSRKCKTLHPNFGQESYQILFWLHGETAQKKHTKLKKTSFCKTSKQSSFERITWKQRSYVLASEKGLKMVKVVALDIITYLCLCEAFYCSIYVQQKSLITAATTKQELPRYPGEQNLRYQSDSLKNSNFQKVVCQSRLFTEQNFA